MRSQKTRLDISSLSRRCEADGCAKWPLYGNEGERAKFCSFHKSAAMIDVRSRRCAAPDCKRQPSYAVEGKRAVFCAAHKEEGMVDVVSRRCEQPNCRRRPLYGYKGQRSQFCSAHKKEGQVDVCNRRCTRSGCSKRPCFGLPGQRPVFCAAHRSPEMVDVISRKCGYPGCSQPTGLEAGRVRARFCDKHKSAGLVGASLLQLAGAAAEDSAPAAPAHPAAFVAFPGKGKRTAGIPRLPWDKTAGAPWNHGSSPGPGSLPEGRRRGQRMEEFAPTPRPAVPEAAAPSRRATYNGRELEEPPEPPDHPMRRATMPAPLLPSVQSLLTHIPPGRLLKRPRAAGDDSSRFSLQVGGGGGGGGGSGGGQPPSSPRGLGGGAAEACRGAEAATPPRLGNGGGGAGERGGGRGDGGGDSGEAPAAGAREGIPATGKNNSGWGGGGGDRQQGDSRLADRHTRTWHANPSLNPGLNHGAPGFVAPAPSLEWRRLGLSSMGRVASFDEAAAAMIKTRGGLRQAAAGEEDPSKPRRSSAFVSHGSALPPVVTEMGRRDSAFEPRALAPSLGGGGASRVPHYSDLLSARAPSRAVTAVNSHRGGGFRYPWAAARNAGAGIEGEGRHGGGGGGGGAALLSGDAGSAGWQPSGWMMPLKNVPAPRRSSTLLPGQAEAPGGGGGGRGGGDDGIAPPPVSRAVARMFHVMPATAAFAGGLASRSQGAEDVGAGAGFGARRMSVAPRASSGPPRKQEEWVTFVPAWGAPPAEVGGAAPGTASSVSSSGGATSLGGGVGGALESSRRQSRRGSMAPAAPPGGAQASDLRRSSFVTPPPGGGVQKEVGQAERPASERQSSAGGGGGVAGSGTASGQGEGVGETRDSRRGSMVSGPA